jgi:hypothetical protein
VSVRLRKCLGRISRTPTNHQGRSASYPYAGERLCTAASAGWPRDERGSTRSCSSAHEGSGEGYAEAFRLGEKPMPPSPPAPTRRACQVAPTMPER